MKTLAIICIINIFLAFFSVRILPLINGCGIVEISLLPCTFNGYDFNKILEPIFTYIFIAFPISIILLALLAFFFGGVFLKAIFNKLFRGSKDNGAKNT